MAIPKARGITTGRGTPQPTQGQNGDITIRDTRQGIKLYAKQANRWHNVNLDVDTLSMFNDIDELKKSVRKLQLKAKNTPIVDKILLRQPNSATAIAIQNKSGAVSFRNSVDGGDVSIKNPKFSSAGTIGDDDNPSINTSSSNVVRLAPNDASADFELRMLHTAAATIDNMITFYQGALGRWAMGYVGDSASIFRINGGVNPITLNEDLLQLNTDGDLTIDGDFQAGGNATLKAGNDAAASLLLQADNSDDAGDDWKIIANADQTFTLANDIISAGSYVPLLTISPNVSGVAASTVATAGSLQVGSNIIKASDGGSTITMDTSDNVTIAGTLSCTELATGAVTWQEFPFITTAMTASRGYYFRDVDDTANSYRRWDAFDADMTISYRNIFGQYVVPEDCTLKYMRGIVANNGATTDVTINIWYCLQADIETDTTATTFTKAGSDEDVTIGTSLVGVQFDEGYNVELTAGSIIIPTLKHANSGASQAYVGNLTLKFVTR